MLIFKLCEIEKEVGLFQTTLQCVYGECLFNCNDYVVKNINQRQLAQHKKQLLKHIEQKETLKGCLILLNEWNRVLDMSESHKEILMGCLKKDPPLALVYNELSGERGVLRIENDSQDKSKMNWFEAITFYPTKKGWKVIERSLPTRTYRNDSPLKRTNHLSKGVEWVWYDRDYIFASLEVNTKEEMETVFKGLVQEQDKKSWVFSQLMLYFRKKYNGSVAVIVRDEVHVKMNRVNVYAEIKQERLHKQKIHIYIYFDLGSYHDTVGFSLPSELIGYEAKFITFLELIMAPYNKRLRYMSRLRG